MPRAATGREAAGHGACRKLLWGEGAAHLPSCALRRARATARLLCGNGWELGNEQRREHNCPSDMPLYDMFMSTSA